MLADPKFREAACAAQDVISADVHARAARRRLLARSSTSCSGPTTCRRSPAPSPATRRARSSARSGPTPPAARCGIEAPGKPSEVTGTITLRPEGGGTVEIVELELKVKVPLIGGKLEKLLAEKVPPAWTPSTASASPGWRGALMAKRLDHDLTYDAPLADVAAMLADPAFREEVCDYQRRAAHDGHRRHDAAAPAWRSSSTRSGRPTASRRSRKKFVGDEINIVQREDGRRSSQRRPRTSTIPGKPGEMSGTHRARRVRRRHDRDRRASRSRSASRWWAARSRG